MLLVIVVALWGLAVLTFGRPGWPRWVGEEATHVLQAESLALDLSLIHISEPTRRRDSSRMPSSA